MSNRLIMSSRPWVAFDASNRQHRQWFTEFERNRTWGKCPVRFIITDDQGDLLTMIQRKLLSYYTSKEFRVNLQ